MPAVRMVLPIAVTLVYCWNGPESTPMEPTRAPWSAMISSAVAVA